MNVHEEFTRSIEFFRSHLDESYQTLLSQARVAFWLWFGCATISFLILVAGISLLYRGNLVEGSVTLAAEVLVFFIQRIFREREDHYRTQAEVKNRHLELGNFWNLATQSADGIGDPALRSEKLARLIDALVDHVRGEKNERASDKRVRRPRGGPSRQQSQPT